MNRSILLGYQGLIGLSDTMTGILLIIAPRLALGLMRLHAPSDALPYMSYLGSFVLAVGLACLYGAVIMLRRGSLCKLETVWLLTATMRASVAIVVAAEALSHTLEVGWLTVAAFDGVCVLIQAIGLRKDWLSNVER